MKLTKSSKKKFLRLNLRRFAIISSIGATILALIVLFVDYFPELLNWSSQFLINQGKQWQISSELDKMSLLALGAVRFGLIIIVLIWIVIGLNPSLKMMWVEDPKQILMRLLIILTIISLLTFAGEILINYLIN